MRSRQYRDRRGKPLNRERTNYSLSDILLTLWRQSHPRAPFAIRASDSSQILRIRQVGGFTLGRGAVLRASPPPTYTILSTNRACSEKSFLGEHPAARLDILGAAHQRCSDR